MPPFYTVTVLFVNFELVHDFEQQGQKDKNRNAG